MDSELVFSHTLLSFFSIWSLISFAILTHINFTYLLSPLITYTSNLGHPFCETFISQWEMIFSSMQSCAKLLSGGY